MMENNYIRSIRLNNEGCERFERGEFLSSRILFRDSLHLMTVAIVDATEETNIQNTCSIPTPVVGDKDWEYQPQLQWSKLPSVTLQTTPEAFVYERACFIVRDDVSTWPNPTELWHVSAMIAYNVGLAFHACGTVTGTMVYLDEALTFYQTAITIRNRAFLRIAGRPEIVDLAAYNNMGQILYEQVNYERSSRCFAALKNCLRYLREKGLINFIPDHDADGFRLNASIQLVTLAPAA
jgi:hypothetical protein